MISASASQLADAIHNGDVTSEEVVEAHLARMRTLQPEINAVVAEMPDAQVQARAADEELATGQIRGPLHGVPFTVKDVFDTAGFATPMDSGIRRRNVPMSDATVLSRLRQAGAILLAKTNSPPNGYGRDTENAVSGRTLNPYNLSCTPGGSSGGEAALIASGGSPMGLGTDQSGGVRVPANYCGVAGLKPTAGRIPNTGVYNQPGGVTDPRSQVGAMARSVDDLEFVLPLLIGPDAHDSGVAPVTWRDSSQVRVKDLTVAYCPEDPAAPVSPEIADAVGAAAQALARHGVTVQPAHPPGFVHVARELDYYWKDMAGTTGRTVVEVYSMWDDYRSNMLAFMARFDAILCPAGPQPAPAYRERDNARFAYTVPFSLTGYPALVIRTGQAADGMPIGLQVAARPWREDVALALGRLLEQEFGGWQRPAQV